MEIRRFSLRYDAPGPWILSGAQRESCVHFRDLAAALSFARDDSGAEEADIELWVDGLYIFVHQWRGWPHRLCASTTSGRRSASSPAFCPLTKPTARGTPRLIAGAESRARR